MIRKLASIRKVLKVIPIEGADKIELVKIDGWQCIVEKGKYKPDDIVVYCEIDSFLPIEESYSFLDRYKKKHNDGSEGYRIKTIKLRGKISQGLVLPLSSLEGKKYPEDTRENPVYDFTEGKEVSALLGIKLYEAPIPQYMKTVLAGGFPAYIRKTDQERVQNLIPEILQHFGEQTKFEATEKVDGTSCTYFKYDDHLGVCSRNYELQPNESIYWEMEKKHDILNKLRGYNRNIAIQGECFGIGVQNNPLGINDKRFYVFDIWDIDKQCYLGSEERMNICLDLELDHVPLLAIEPLNTANVENIVELSKGNSRINKTKIREGIVYKSIDGSFSFKAINNDYLVGVEQ